MPLAVPDQVRDAGHRPVVVHDLADDAGRREPGEAREVDRGLGLAGALEHAAARARGAGRRGPGETRSCGVEVGSTATWIVRARSAAEMPVETPSRASIETVNAVPNCASFWSVIWRSPSSSQRSGVRQRQISPRPCDGHEVDRVRRDELRGDRQVALVLAVLVVDDDDEAAGADLLDRLLDGGERARLGLGHGGHRVIVAPAPRAARRTSRARRPRGSPAARERGRAASSPRACAGRARPRTRPRAAPRP